MNENEILERFGEVTGETEPVKLESIKGEDPDIVSVYGFFNATDEDKNDRDFKEKIKLIVEFAKEGAKDRADVLWNIKTLESKLGDPAYGSSRIDNLYNYIKLQNQIKVTTKEAAVYERGINESTS